MLGVRVCVTCHCASRMHARGNAETPEQFRDTDNSADPRPAG